MNNSDKFEECKKDIRSILISYQKGCYLSDLIKAYKDIIGKGLPTREFGHQTEIEFLRSMPDVARINKSKTGDYLLQGIADKKTEHIQKMVHKQKPTKLKPPKPSKSYINSYAIPPIKSSKSYINSYAIPPIKSSKSYTSSYVNPPRFNQNFPQILKYLPSVKSAPVTNLASPKEEIVSVVKSSKHSIALSNILLEYKKMYNKNFILSEYGFSSLQECIESVSDLDIVNQNDESYVIYRSKSSRLSENNSVEETKDNTTLRKNYLQNHAEDSSIKSAASKSNLDNCRSRTNSNVYVSESMIDKLQKVAKKYPQGIRSINFPACFKEVTNCSFDMHSLGYNRLTDFLDDVPDIFVRKFVMGNKADYIIYPADKLNLEINEIDDNSSLPKVGPTVIDHIILNIRSILEAYSEGILLKNLLYIYSINCHDPLCVNDLGFDDLETFLNSIKERVPLRIENLNGEKNIYIFKLSDCEIELPCASPQVCEQEDIPFDAEIPEFEFGQFSFCTNFDFSKYYAVFVSSVINPSHLYIQLQRGKITQIFEKLSEDLDNFYNGDQSKLYMMRNIHIKPGASCVALWPTDQHWYRVKILSISDNETVKVHHIDYGSRDYVPKSLLRYIKKDYAKFPSLAIKCCLSFLKPAKNATKWDPLAKDRLLKMVRDISLMAKIEMAMDSGMYSVVLCDTNSEKDVYINDVLFNEGFADHYVEDKPTKSIPPSPEPVNLKPQPVQAMEYHNLNALQALQARYYLQVFAAVAPSFIHNKHYLTLLQQISMYCPKTDPTTQTVANLFSENVSKDGNQILTNNIILNNASTSSLNSRKVNVLNDYLSAEKGYVITPPPLESSPTDLCATSISIGCSAVEDKDGDSEIFDDDDDDMFQEFYQKVTTRKRFVKRIILDDSYKIHIILVQSKPCASSGDISKLIWNNKEADYLYRRLQIKEVDIPTINVSEDDNEELFIQLERFNVKGIQKTTGFKSSILLYPLKIVIKILNVFGHPSLSLRKKLDEEILNFNPNDPMWQEFSASEISEPDAEENLIYETDDDKIERLCLSDLHAMKESIKCRRMLMVKNFNSSKNREYVEEISKLEARQLKIHKRIDEINIICDMFS